MLIGDHGGYQGDLKSVADRLNRTWAGTGTRAHYIAQYYRAATAGFTALLEKNGYSRAEIGTHAGAADTSLTMALDPRLVRTERLRAGTPLDAAHGVYGDPRRSSAALGQQAADTIVSQTVASIRAAVNAK